MKKTKRIISFILTCLMAVSAFVFTASAAKDPVYVLRANAGVQSAGFSAEAVTATLGHDTANDIVYYHFVPKDKNDWMHFAWHEAANKFKWSEPMTLGVVMRTNKAGAIPSVRFCDRQDKNVFITKKASPIKGDGTWEVVWFPEVTAQDVTENGFVGLTHVQGFAVGEALVGKDNLTSGTYFDIAGYAFFNDTANNLSSVDLIKTLGLGDTGKLQFAITDNGKPSTFVPSESATPSSDDLVLDYTKMQRGVCENKDTGTVTVVEDDAVGKAVKFTINPAATQQDHIVIDGYGAETFGIDLAKYRYMHIEMKLESSTITSLVPNMRFLSTKDGSVEGAPYLDATELKADGKWQTVTIDMSVLAGKYTGSSIMKHLQFSVGGRKYKAGDFGVNDSISVSKIVLSNSSTYTSSATGSGSVSTEATGPKFDAEDKVIAYPPMQRGICDNKDTGVVEVVKDGDRDVVRVTVNPTAEKMDYVTVDGYGAESFGVDIAKYKYMLIEMKFESDTIDNIYPVMRFLSTKEGNISGAPYLTSSIALPSDGQWHTVGINMYDGLAHTKAINADSVIMKHMQFSVGGRQFQANNFGEGDKIYISKITLTNVSPNKDKDFKVSFANSFALATGTAPADIVGKPGTKFTVPEIPFTADGYKAYGWMLSVGSDIIMPGTEMTIPENDLHFSVNWKEVVEAKDFISIDYAPYFNGICDNVDTGKAQVTSINGKPVVEFIPNPNTTSTKGEAINLDGWSYGSANINLSLYKTIIIEYLYLSDNPVQGNAKFNVMSRSNFTGQIQTVAREPIVEGRWAVASFDMTAGESKFIATAEPKILQAHIYPLGSNSVKNMSENDRIYVGKIIAIPEVSASAVQHESYINGYADGTFGISGNMTRAEACTIVARLAAGGDANVPTDKTSSFTDVTADQWYHKYIAYVESLGYLKSYSGTFLPNQNITRAEFVELVYNMGLLQDAGKNGTFTDVPADHARVTVIAAAGKAGLVNGYANGDGTFSFKPDATITRAEVVKVINNAYGKKPTADGIFDTAKTKFSDVTPDHWAFADIIDASVSHISYVDAEGKEFWKYVDDSTISADGFVADYETGAAKLAEYNALFDKRAEEILGTPNMDLSGITGKKYYVSSSMGDDANDGLSPEKPFKTIAKATNMAVTGDAILLKRGDTWRERFKARGVLYTAYGEGAKPVINFNLHGDVADESLWTLVEGTTNIWKYAKEIPDVGNIIVNGNKTITKFTAGVKYQNNGTYVGSELLDPVKHLSTDNYFVSLFTEVNGTSANMDKSILYVRCDAGNPGAVYDTIELAYRGSGIQAVSNTTIDNIAIFYAGSHGISMGTVNNVKYTNLEIGWIGGSAQNTTNGVMTRFGNGIEVYGGCDNFVIDNCYVYQCYDAGITHQKQLGSTDNCTEKNVWFTNNVIDRCIYNIEYFMGKADKEGVTRLMENITYEGNLLARSGYGWGYAPSRSASIKGWDHHNNHAINFNIKNNVFIMDRVNAMDAGYGNVSWMPNLSGNTYIQKYGNTFIKLGTNGATQYIFDGNAAQNLKDRLGEDGAVLYYVDKNTAVEEIK